MTDNDAKSDNGSVWSNLPAILGGTAAVLTAIAGLVIAFGGDRRETPPRTETSVDSSGESEPAEDLSRQGSSPDVVPKQSNDAPRTTPISGRTLSPPLPRNLCRLRNERRLQTQMSTVHFRDAVLVSELPIKLREDPNETGVLICYLEKDIIYRIYEEGGEWAWVILPSGLMGYSKSAAFRYTE